MLSAIGFVLVLIPLVVVHELGHFLFAKLFNVRADAFSVGFGPVLYQKKWGETDFRVSAIPLGGYVKLLGEDPGQELSPEDKKRALNYAKPLHRFLIYFGGPLFNFIWAALVFMFMMVIGEPQIGTQIGRVLKDSPAEKAGFVSGDEVTQIQGKPVKKIEEMMFALADYPGQTITVQVKRQDQLKDLQVTTGSEEGFSIYGEKKQVGTIDGIVGNARLPKVALVGKDSLASKAGFELGDEIQSINGMKVSTFEELEAEYASWMVMAEQKTKNPVQFEVKKSDGQIKNIELTTSYSGSLEKDFGLVSSELVIDQLMPGAPAEKAGIQKLDRVLEVNSEKIVSFFQLREKIQKVGESGQEVKVKLERQGAPVEVALKPQESAERDPLLRKKVQYTIGIMPIASMKEPYTVIERTLNPFVLVYKGVARMLDLSAKNLISIGKMVKGDVSVKSLGGPILIGKLAGDSIGRGLIDFLKMMAVLSIGLGILNILPIPVLDGGHIVLLGVEVIRGRKLSLKQVEVAQQVGLAVVLSIMVIVMKNDLSRLPIFN